MKGTLERDILEKLEELWLSDGMKTVVASADDLYGDYSLEDIAAVYRNEEDADKIKKTPCLLLYPNGWRVLKAITGGYVYEFAVIVAAFDQIKASEGTTATHEKVATYLGCAMEFLFTSHSRVYGYWSGARPDQPAAINDFVQEQLGAIGRSRCHQIILEVSVTY